MTVFVTDVPIELTVPDYYKIIVTVVAHVMHVMQILNMLVLEHWMIVMHEIFIEQRSIDIQEILQN